MEYGRSLFVLRKSRPVTPEVAGSSPVSLARTRGQGEAAGAREINAAGLAYAAQLKSLNNAQVALGGHGPMIPWNGAGRQAATAAYQFRTRNGRKTRAQNANR